MVIILTIIHVIVCFFLMVVVLLQSGKAADLAGAFGGMGSQTAFGPRGSATVLSRATTVAAAVFMVTSLTLAILATRNSGTTGSVLERQIAPAKTTATPVPATTPNGNTSVPLPGIPSAPAQAAPGQAAPGQAAPAAPGQGTPSLTIIRPDGTKTTQPITIPPAPKQPAPKK
ncbi:MAG TPA: preprotein translocase subunit SecG [Candidatus Sulfopaludibacter sp.]|nr:preprotein translocase subunit SecG [Candidatus Sulfopaludibacter sp.]